jgi:hypothetical protein
MRFPISYVKEGDEVGAEAYNALAGAFNALVLTVAPGGDLSITDGVIWSSRPWEGWIRLTAVTGSGSTEAFAWECVARDDSGGWEATAFFGTTTDNPAKRTDGSATVTLPLIVWGRQSPDAVIFQVSDCG